MQMDLFGYTVEINDTLTRSWYAGASAWGCDCGHCRNFVALATSGQLPTPVLNTLRQFGIPPEKATYVCEMYPDGDGFHYQFSYRIAGKIIEENKTPQLQPWGQGDCCHEPYPYGAPGFPTPHFDLEFWVTLPWVLDEPANGKESGT